MTRRRRAVLLSGLALLLGALAAADVAGREAALTARIGSPVPVVVAATDIPRGAPLRPAVLAVRELPARYAPALSFARAAQLAGRHTAVALPRGTAVVAAMLDTGEQEAAGGPTLDLRPGERVAELVARGSADLVVPGGRVDVLVTREHATGAGSTTLALEDAEVLSAQPAPAADGDDARAAPQVRVSLRVTVRQAVALAADQNFAREIRLLPRAAGDHRRGLQGLRLGAG